MTIFAPAQRAFETLRLRARVAERGIFEKKSVDDRYAETDKAREIFGKKYIVLPNAMYGTWENAIYEYGRLTDVQKAEKRLNALQLP